MSSHFQLSSDEIIKRFQLEEHPEGGFYKRIFESNNTILSNNSNDKCPNLRPLMTQVLYMLKNNDICALHQLIDSDEVWTFLSGNRSILIIEINPSNGKLKKTILGSLNYSNPIVNCIHTVRCGIWFGAYLINNNLNYEKVIIQTNKQSNEHDCIKSFSSSTIDRIENFENVNKLDNFNNDKNSDNFAFVSCAVSPGFQFDKWKLAKRSELLQQFPQHSQIIEKLTIG